MRSTGTDTGPSDGAIASTSRVTVQLLNQNNSALFIEEATHWQDYWESTVRARSDFP